MTTNETAPMTVFRATRRARNVVLVAYCTPVLFVIPIVVLTVLFPPIWPFSLAVVLAQIIGLVYGILYVVRTRMEFGGGSYRQVFALTEHAFTVDDVEKVMPVEALDYGLQSAPHLFVVGKTRRGLVQLNDQVVERAQLEALVNDLAGRGVPVEHVTGRITVRQFARAHPGVLPWQLTHRALFLLLVALVTLVVLGGFGIWAVDNVVTSLTP
jgi:hypothetical protein